MDHRRAAVAALALAATGARAAGPLVVQGPAGDVEVEADTMTANWDTRVVHLDGHLRVVRGDATLRAGSGTLDRDKGTLALQGGILGVQGREVFLADSALLDLTSRAADLAHAALFLKDRPQGPAALAAPGAARSLGRNALTLTGKRVHREQGGALVAEEVTLTPCDCAAEPDYALASPEVRIEGDRARLQSPRLLLLGASVPLFIPLSLPLTDRQSGLFFPQLGFTSVTGLGAALPIFVVLNRSYDLTLTPGLYTSSGRSANPALGARSVAGPRLGLELRYAPHWSTRGSLSFDLLDDLHQGSSAAPPAPFAGEEGASAGRGFGGLRGIVHLSHRTEAFGVVAAAQGALATDAMLVPDTEPSQLERYLDALRTDAGVWLADGALTVGAGATLLQDVRIPDAAHPDRRLFGPERRETFQRLPGVFAQLAPVALGPAALSVEATAVAFTPLSRTGAEERATGFGPTDLGAAAASSLPAAGPLGGARGRTLRFDLAPRLSADVPAGPVSLQLYGGARAGAWLFDEDATRDTRRAYALGGLRAAVELSRPFGDVLHVVAPGLEVRAISPSLRSGGAPVGDPDDAGGALYGSDPSAAEQGLLPGAARRADLGGQVTGVPAARRAYDEVDFAAPQAGAVVAMPGLRQSVWARTGRGAPPVRLARLDLFQDLVLWGGAGGRARVGESVAAASVQVARVSASGQVRFDWTSRAVTSVLSGAQVRDARGDEVHGGLLLLRGIASERMRAGADELFAAARPAARQGDLLGSISVGGAAALPFQRQGLRASLDLSGHLGPLPPDAGDLSIRPALAYEPPCRCASVQLAADLPLRGGHLLRAPSFHFNLDLKSLGSFASF